MNSTFHQNEVPFSLSIIIPNFNDAKFLKECIDSIVTQSVTPDELIILDDASTDNSIEVISKAISSYPFARIEHNPVNLGFGGVPNANRGLQLAKSKYVYFLGANDFILPGLIEAIKNGLEAYPQAGVFSAMVWLVNEQSDFLQIHRSPVLSLQQKFFPAKQCQEMMIKSGSWLTGQTLVYRREALLEAGGFRVSLKGLCDLLAAQVVVSRYGAVFSPSPLGVMRIHAGALLVDTLVDTKLLEEILNEVALAGFAIEPKLFTPAMLKRTRLRLYFASLRLSKGKTLNHVVSKVGFIRKFALSLTTLLPIKLYTPAFFVIMRPFDVIASIWYRAIGSSYVILREQMLRQYPPYLQMTK